MASSKLMSSSASSSSAARQSDLIRRKSSSASSSRLLSAITSSGAGYGVGPAAAAGEGTISLIDAVGAVTAIEDSVVARRQESVHTPNHGSRTVEDVWKEIVAGRSCKQEAPEEMMTLEDFLAKAGAVDEEDVKVAPPPLLTERSSGGIYQFDIPIPNSVDGVAGLGVGVEGIGGRGKRKAVLLEPMDKASLQRQKRMIKNRESAARSRERKQAYQMELESLAVKLEEENEKLLKEKAERDTERLKQLMENIIPVVEERRPPRPLRKVRSMQW